MKTYTWRSPGCSIFVGTSEECLRKLTEHGHGAVYAMLPGLLPMSFTYPVDITEKLPVGTRVRMSVAFKGLLLATGALTHVKEFGNTVGTVIGPMELGWPEYDVMWGDTGLKYGYSAENLDVVERVIGDTRSFSR